MPRFSVLLPTHNRADVLPYAIQSVLDQTVDDFELLVVNDGSTDGTEQVAHAFNDPRIKWFNLPKAPHFGYANRNIALRQASGDLVAFAAHDDLLLPDHLAVMAEPFQNAETELAYSMPLWVMPDGTVIPAPGNLHFSDELDRFLDGSNFIPACCVTHRRACLERYGYWPEHVTNAGDWVVWRNIIEGGKRGNFSYLPIPTSMHFKAVWRSWSILQVEAMVKIVNDLTWWPSCLRLEVTGDRPEQVDFAEAMGAHPREWVTMLRAGVSASLSRLAVDQAQLLVREREAVHRLEDNLACVEGAMHQRSALLGKLSRDLDRFSQQVSTEIAVMKETPPSEFDEVAYLTHNPDVALAVADGSCVSAYAHWLNMHWHEMRQFRL